MRKVHEVFAVVDAPRIEYLRVYGYLKRVDGALALAGNVELRRKSYVTH